MFQKLWLSGITIAKTSLSTVMRLCSTGPNVGEDRNDASLSHAPTLEAQCTSSAKAKTFLQRIIIPGLFGEDVDHKRTMERKIANVLVKLSGKAKNDLKKMLSMYKHIKARPAYLIASNRFQSWAFTEKIEGDSITSMSTCL